MSPTVPSQSLGPTVGLDEVLDLAAEIARDANRLCRVIGQISDVPTFARPISCKTRHPRSASLISQRDADAIKGYLRARRNREAYFPEGLFADPAWDLLLDLYVAQTEGREVSVSSACIAAGVPATTGLRWLASLEKKALITRHQDHQDGRRSWVKIARPALKGINLWLDSMWPLTEIKNSGARNVQGEHLSSSMEDDNPVIALA